MGGGWEKMWARGKWNGKEREGREVEGSLGGKVQDVIWNEGEKRGKGVRWRGV